MRYIFFFIFIFSSHIKAEQKPLTEIGVAGGIGYLPDYPAANQGRYKTLVLPTIIYRGEVFSTQGGVAKADFFSGEKVKFDLSLSASLPSNSKDNVAREGMEDLDWIFEIGPRFIYKLINNDEHKLQFELPARFIYSTNFNKAGYHGQRFTPELDYKNYAISPVSILFVSAGLDYGSEFLNDYFYEVTSEDVTDSRSKYNAGPGYIGAFLSVGVYIPIKDYKTFIGMKYNNYSQSANENSPLYKSNENTSIYMGFNYNLYKSKKMSKDQDRLF